MKQKIALLGLISLIAVSAFAYRDSANYDSGDGGFIFALILIGLFIIAPIIGFFETYSNNAFSTSIYF